MNLLLETLLKEDKVNEVDWGKVAASVALGAAALTSPVDASSKVNAPTKVEQQQHFDRKMLYDVVWAESWHSEEEVKATASVYLNRIRMYGANKAFQGSSAHNKDSKQYAKAKNLDFDSYERKVYNRQKVWIDELINDSSKVLPYDYHENIKAYGTPNWAKSMASHVDVGKQRFYTSYELARQLQH